MAVQKAAARRTCAWRQWPGSATAWAVVATTLLLSGCEAGGSYPQTTFRTVSEFGDALNRVFYNTVAWTMLVTVVVFGLVLYIAVRFRERPDAPTPRQVHGHTGLEITWTVIPALIVVAIGVPTVKTLFETQRRPPDDALVVEVIGHQWWWEFRYPEYGIVTANQAWVPTGRPVSLQMHSADVVHSFWIPRIGGKRDTNPLPRRRDGEPAAHKNYLLFTVREPGHYTGQCAEFCGESHAIMRMSVMAAEPAEFAEWVTRMRAAEPAGAAAAAAAAADTAQAGVAQAGVAQAGVAQAGVAQAGMAQADTVRADTAQPPAVTATPAAQTQLGQLRPPTGAGNPFVVPLDDAALVREGERIFLGAACVACHAVAGTGAVGVLGPALTRYGERPWVGAGAAENSLEHVIRWIRDPQSMKPGVLMPGSLRGAAGMPPTGLTDVEVRAVAAYLLSLK
jgi:cytochrome c oxidase subunit II